MCADARPLLCTHLEGHCGGHYCCREATCHPFWMAFLTGEKNAHPSSSVPLSSYCSFQGLPSGVLHIRVFKLCIISFWENYQSFDSMTLLGRNCMLWLLREILTLCVAVAQAYVCVVHEVLLVAMRLQQLLCNSSWSSRVWLYTFSLREMVLSCCVCRPYQVQLHCEPRAATGLLWLVCIIRPAMLNLVSGWPAADTRPFVQAMERQQPAGTADDTSPTSVFEKSVFDEVKPASDPQDGVEVNLCCILR